MSDWPNRDAIVDAICEQLAEGVNFREIMRHAPADWPKRRTIDDWRKADPEGIGARFDTARDEGYDAIASQCLDIADDSRNDWIEARAEEGDERADTARQNGEVVQRSRLRIDTRLKLLAKWDPRRYGDKIEHSGPGGNALFPTTVEFVFVDAKNGKPA